MIIAKIQVKHDCLYIWILGCTHRCKGCKKNPPRFDIKNNYNEYKKKISNIMNEYDICQAIILGDDPLYCGNKKELLDLTSNLDVHKISIISKYKPNWFNNDKHIGIVSK